MNTLTLNIEPGYIERIASLARAKGETPDQFLSKLISEYLARTESEGDAIALMKLSESSFSEWDNEDDAVYDAM